MYTDAYVGLLVVSRTLYVREVYFCNFGPEKRFQNSSDVRRFGCSDDSTNDKVFFRVCIFANLGLVDGCND